MEASRILVGFSVLLISVIFIQSSAFEFSDLPKHCSKEKPRPSNYTPRGSEYEIGNLTVYDSDNRAARRLVIAVYDVFGPSNQMKEIADTLAELYDFRVILPDFFRGFPWDMDDVPPSDPEEFERWYSGNASWEKIVKWDVKTVIDTFRSNDNISEVAIFGMCWGGRISTLAATEFPEVKAAGLVHPSRVNESMAPAVNAPMYLLPGRDDPDYLPFLEILRENFGSNCGHRRFDDLDHGFAGATGNFSDPLNRMRVDEVIYILGGFFTRNLRN